MGWLVSDHLAYHFLFGDGLAGSDPTVKTHPPDLEARLAPLVVRPSAIGAAELAPFADVPTADLEKPLDLADDLSHLRWLVGTAESYRRIGLELGLLASGDFSASRSTAGSQRWPANE